MPALPLRHRVPARLPARALLGGLEGSFALRSENPVSLRRSFVDTADWRVYAAGWILQADVETEGHPRPPVTLTLRDRRSEAVLATVKAAELPNYASDLPPTGVWPSVAAAVDIRRLLVQVEAETRSQRLSVLNRDRKTTARVVLERHEVRPDGARRQRVVRTATVVPIRGYETTARRAASLLVQAGARPDDSTLLETAMKLAERPAPGTKLGPGVALRRSWPAVKAVSAVLERLRYHVLLNEAGSRDQLDIEFLHEYRVAIRRARSMVRRAEGILDPDRSDSLAAELAWLATLTSPVRDFDVYLQELGPAGGDDLDPLRKYLETQRRTAQATLVEAFDSSRYRELMESWRTVGDSVARPSAAPRAYQPIGAVADEYIGRAYRRVLRRGSAIDDTTPAEALHDLRKRAKELRYLLECFQTLYPDGPRAAAVRELKALQDNLGEFQDCQVQAATLHRMADALMKSRGTPAATLMAMGRLADDQEQREYRARAEFESRFARFASDANQERFADLVGPGKKDAR